MVLNVEYCLKFCFLFIPWIAAARYTACVAGCSVHDMMEWVLTTIVLPFFADVHVPFCHPDSSNSDMRTCETCWGVLPIGHQHHNASTCPHNDFACRHTLPVDDAFYLPLSVHFHGDLNGGGVCNRICSVCKGVGHEPCSQVPRAGRWELRNDNVVACRPQRPLDANDFACPAHHFVPDPPVS